MAGLTAEGVPIRSEAVPVASATGLIATIIVLAIIGYRCARHVAIRKVAP